MMIARARVCADAKVMAWRDDWLTKMISMTFPKGEERVDHIKVSSVVEYLYVESVGWVNIF